MCNTFIFFTIMQYLPLLELLSVLYSFLASEKLRAPLSNQDKFELDRVGCSIPREKHQLYSCVTVLFVVNAGLVKLCYSNILKPKKCGREQDHVTNTILTPLFFMP